MMANINENTDSMTHHRDMKQSDLPDDTCMSQVGSTALLQDIIKKKDVEINYLIKRAEKAERLLEKANSYNDDLKAQIASLSSELHEYRSLKKFGKLIQLQVSENDRNEAYNEKPMPTWGSSEPGDNPSLSISESLKAVAEEVIQDQNLVESETDHPEKEEETSSEYVYDAESGFYYHPASGYYWDPASSLFYDYTSGIYYQYDEATDEYKVHSQVDVSGNDQVSQTSEAQHEIKGEARKRKRRIKRHRGQDGIETKDVIVIEENEGLKKQVNKRIKKKNIQHSKGSNSCVKKEELIEVSSESESDEESSGSLATGESELVSSPEPGEISEESIEILEDCSKPETAGALPQPLQYFDELAEYHPPCVRLIVLGSEQLKEGSLYIITCAGGTIGREPNSSHGLEIPDLNVSKVHAQVDYDYNQKGYFIADKGSQNGTLLNKKRLSESKVESAAHRLHHGDIVEIGSTRFLLHIHAGHETCEDCEPGQVQAKLRALNPVQNDHVVLSKDEKNKQRFRELKKIKKKYGLQNSHFENAGACISKSNDYADKAYLRRKYIGSEPPGTVCTTDEMPASIQNPISASNKGHKLLSKMGWKEGEGLGKTGSGIAAPVNVELRVNQKAGLGSSLNYSLSLDNVDKAKKAQRWTTAQQAYNRLEAQEAHSSQQSLNLNTSSNKNREHQVHSEEYQSLLQEMDRPLPSSSSLQSSSLPSSTAATSSDHITGSQPLLLSASHIKTSLKKYSSVPKISWVQGKTQNPPTH